MIRITPFVGTIVHVRYLFWSSCDAYVWWIVHYSMRISNSWGGGRGIGQSRIPIMRRIT